MNAYTAHLLLGTNVGDREGYLSFAVEKISQLAGKIVHISQIYQTAAWGFTQQADFLNQALVVDTPHEPETLLSILQEIENQAGRQRLFKWGPRTLDIDIIAIDDLVIHSAKLCVPHPAMAQRRFVLHPLADLLPTWRHPLTGLTYAQMLATCQDTSLVQKYQRL
ncbi:MAG: 2-amino-4-hydroxy-6-hydroxymethyldihydropteridine diphosphokinase [Cytophagales bacterium]|nr:2-amino-4-hydroxy-6-hydroxymethyldihydropteridine diphosphokinase [Bernardetiaceae bacterium]MDW8210799.1 2-amino-4-hydroxy-6-hydroxymethyldihydropteridine diphosphokinase [Cytophagales bacterium]